jgi:hypothetical protein
MGSIKQSAWSIRGMETILPVILLLLSFLSLQCYHKPIENRVRGSYCVAFFGGMFSIGFKLQLAFCFSQNAFDCI